ncbi:DNA-directed RNA polymerase I subunit rpa49 [Coelomomyces lativittatus]|nr:DNA-directed RNA polymerase I subunit rpa49 [Coelomomyces lativittatus]KAJ1510602.1 DNA-directed RNA polymerase I subunit rpa49 [Coelomomyces lativittatus]
MAEKYHFELDKDLQSDSLPPFYLALSNNGIDLEDNTKVKMYEKHSNHTRTFVAHAETPLEFVGSSIHDSLSSGTQYFVGIVEQNSKRIRVFPTPLLHMQRVLKRDKEEAIEENEMESTKEDLSNVRAQRVALGSAFGTKKAKKMFDSVSKNKIDVEILENTATVLSSSVHAANETMNSQQSEKQKSKKESLSPLPPYDLNAQKPVLIYPLQKMLKKELLEELKLITDAFSGNPADASRKFQALFNEPPLCPSDILSQNKPVALFFHFTARLLQMDKRSPLSIETLSKFLNCSERMAYLLLDCLFPSSSSGHSSSSFSSTKHKLTPQSTLRISLHTIVASLHMMNFRVSIQFLSEALKLSTTLISKYVKQCGCHIESGSGSSYAKHLGLCYAVLKAPVVFPDMNSSYKRMGPG